MPRGDGARRWGRAAPGDAPGAESVGPEGRPGPPWASVAALAWIGILSAAAALVSFLPVPDPNVEVGQSLLPPFQSWGELFGTDRFGRSQLSRLLYGARVSLIVGIVSTTLGFLIGGTAGVVAGFYRRRVDSALSTFTDAALAFPPLVLLLALAGTLGASLPTVVVGLAAVSCPPFFRLARANTLRFSETEFVAAAHIAGATRRRILYREIVPNVLPAVLAYATVVVATLMVAEASMSYLGVGIPPPNPSWGGLIAGGQGDLEPHPELVFIPGAVLFLTVTAFTVLGGRLMRRFDMSEVKA